MGIRGNKKGSKKAVLCPTGELKGFSDTMEHLRLLPNYLPNMSDVNQVMLLRLIQYILTFLVLSETFLKLPYFLKNYKKKCYLIFFIKNVFP